MALVKIYDREIEYEVSYRNVKYPRLEFKTGKLLLVLPKNYGNEKKIIDKHKDWIYRKSLIIEEAKRKAKKKRIENRNEEELRNIIKKLVKKFSDDLGVKVNIIYFRRLKSKWGSCSNKSNLSFNTLLKYLPYDLIKYVVFHEITHLKERKHNKKFWEIMSKKFRDYEKKEKDLLAYWFLIQEIERME
ncbi:MAG TPA: M48 family peptidase [Thermoplasmatales archaeon]|nr:M48 family peptidase [Thermoplasmatales archaeon]